MKNTSWVAVVAAVISALGALSAWWGVRKTRTLNVYHQTGITMVQLNQIFIEQPELRPYFIENGKLPKGLEQKAKALASLMLNDFEIIFSLDSALGKKERRAWKLYADHQIKKVPIAHELYKQNGKWYPNLVRVMEKPDY